MNENLAGMRKLLLRYLNGWQARRSRRLERPRCVPSFIVVTPAVVPLAPLAARNAASWIEPVFVANGLIREDIQWLRRFSPETRILKLTGSLGGNLASLLDHGSVIDALAWDRYEPFYIQDADCFILDPTFWDTMTVDPSVNYAVGPFVREPTSPCRSFPETFLLGLNGSLMNALRRKHAIYSSASEVPTSRARRFLAAAGYPEGRYLETLKAYYDTLQQYWVAAEHFGYQFRRCAGENDAVHHVGGTSYLHREANELDHWDYWPLAVHYLYLKLLELPACEIFEKRFESLRSLHGTVGSLLIQHPDFATGWRRQKIDVILSATKANHLYRSPRL